MRREIEEIWKMGRILSVLLLLFLLWMGAAKRSETVDKTAPEIEKTETLVVAYPTGAAFYVEDQKMVEEAIQKIVWEKMKIQVEFHTVIWNYEEEISSMMAGNQPLDILFCNSDMRAKMHMNQDLCELNELLAQYGQGIVDAVGMETIDTCRDTNGNLYGLPNNRDYAVIWDGYILSKEVLDRYRIREEEITDIEKLEEVFAIVKEGEPDMEILDCDGESLMVNQVCAYSAGKMPFGIHGDGGRDETLSNLFYSEEYEELLERFYRWHQLGYVEKNMLRNRYSIDYKMSQGKLFAYACKGKPGIEQQEKMSYGKDVVFVSFGESSLIANSSAAISWGITNNSKSKEKAMELLNLFYTDADIMNLFSYGVEGVHYVCQEDGHITFPEGKKTNPFIGESWRMPNQFITYVWEGNPLTLWEEMKAFTDESFHDCEYGFNFDISPVYTEYLELESVYQKYRYILENGMVEPKAGLEQMNKELDAHFLDEVIREKQRQYTIWRSGK